MVSDISYIKKVNITKIWGGSNIVWDLQPDVNILSGKNGAGKSTILSCMLNSLFSTQFFEKNNGVAESVKLTFDNNCFSEYSLIKVKGSISDLQKRAKNNKDVREIVADLKKEEGKNFSRIKSVSVERHKISYESLGFSLKDFQDFIKLDVVSNFDSRIKSSEELKKISGDDIETDLDLEIFKLKEKYLDYQLNISRRKDQIVAQDENVRQMFDDLLKPRKRFIEIINEMMKETRKILDESKNSIEFLLEGKTILPYQLSSGEKQLLIILLTVLVQDKKKSIMFMDEPEISLHIDWQKKIISHIRELNPNCQLIIATHSPAMIMEGWLDKVTEIKEIVV